MTIPIDSLIAAKAAAVAGWLALLFVLERLRPAAPWPAEQGRFGWRRVARNAALWAINTALSPLVVVPLAAWAGGLHVGLRPAWWNTALDLLVLDLWVYAWHRANHEVPLLWRFHAVHHLDPFLDTTSAVRFHFGEVLLSTLARLPVIVALDMPLLSVVLFEALVLAAALFHHSNLKLPAGLERALSWLVVTPSIHWVHHHAVRADTDSNYATVLSVWDRLFGSRSPTPRTPTMPIGLEGAREPGFAALLLSPFRRPVSRRAPAGSPGP